MLARKDLGIAGNTDRRIFWEMCASRVPRKLYQGRDGDITDFYEDPDDVAKWADQMLDEWDNRWIAEED